MQKVLRVKSDKAAGAWIWQKPEATLITQIKSCFWGLKSSKVQKRTRTDWAQTGTLGHTFLKEFSLWGKKEARHGQEEGQERGFCFFFNI